jgi:HEAT repeat protein
MEDLRLVSVVATLFEDPDERIRADACYAARKNWDSSFAPKVIQLLSDHETRVRYAACNCLTTHAGDSARHVPDYRRLLAAKGAASLSAISLLRFHHAEIPKTALLPLLSSHDACTIETALWGQEFELDEISPLLTNSLAVARYRGLTILLQKHDKAAIDHMVSMLRDPHEGICWIVRQNLRRMTGLKLGPDPAAWEKWWADNRETFMPAPAARPAFQGK